MSEERRKTGISGERRVPYPTWTAIAAEVGATTRRDDAARPSQGGKGWHDLLADDEAGSRARAETPLRR